MFPGMQAPQIPNVPTGLEYLAQVDQLVVQLLEAVAGFEQANGYEMKNSIGPARLLDPGGKRLRDEELLRAFQMSVVNNANVEVLRFDRPLRCQSCCCFCCLQQMTVTVSGVETGYLKQKCSLLRPVYGVLDHNNEEVLVIRGPLCTDFCCGTVEFEVLSNDGSEVGRIVKNFSGFLKEAFTDADTFSVSFPLDLDVRVKATLLAAVFLIDFMYFENNEPNRDNQLLR